MTLTCMADKVIITFMKIARKFLNAGPWSLCFYGAFCPKRKAVWFWHRAWRRQNKVCFASQDALEVDFQVKMCAGSWRFIYSQGRETTCMDLVKLSWVLSYVDLHELSQVDLENWQMIIRAPIAAQKQLISTSSHIQRPSHQIERAICLGSQYMRTPFQKGREEGSRHVEVRVEGRKAKIFNLFDIYRHTKVSSTNPGQSVRRPWYFRISILSVSLRPHKVSRWT